MTPEGISSLMDCAKQYLLEKEISPVRTNKVLLAIEESQMEEVKKNPNAEQQKIECTIFVEDRITLILRNTGVPNNPFEGGENTKNIDPIRLLILSSMKHKSHILVNGSNRLIFKF